MKNFKTSLLRLVGLAYGIVQKKSISHSQKGEDLILKSYFDQIGLENGYYLDIGCFHPTWISNTHLFHKKGWTGAAVDIDDFKLRAMSLLRRKKVQTILAAINIDEIVKTTTVYKFKRVWSDIDTLDKKTAEKYKSEGRGEFVEAEVNCITINTLLSQLPKVNLLNIDIEGLDHLIVQDINFKKYSPDVILFEDNENWGGDKKTQNKLLENGYNLLFISGGSVAYAKMHKND